MTTSVEIDPVFQQALRLLHSRSKDSYDQLYAMLEDAKQRRTGIRNSPIGFKKDILAKMDVTAKSRSASPLSLSRKDEREGEKRSLDKLHDEIGELNSFIKDSSSKRMKLSPHAPSPSSSRGSDSYKKSEESDSKSDEDDLLKEIMIELKCVVCKRMDVSQRNQLVECQECHVLYHQDCHVPQIPMEMTDPREVWYCDKCSKSMKKAQSMSKISKSSSKGGNSSSRRDSSASSKSEKKEMPSESILKRSDSKSSSASSSTPVSSSSKSGGMAGLAASLKNSSSGSKSTKFSSHSSSSSTSSNSSSNGNGKGMIFGNFSSGNTLGGSSSKSKSSSSKPTSSSSSKTTSSTGTSSMISADRRLQIMKKKAKEQQQKKKLSK